MFAYINSKTKIMKRKIVYTFALLAVIFLSQCGPTMQDAIDYNDKMIAEESLVIDRINDLDNAMASWDPAEIQPALDAAKAQVEKSIKALEEMGGFDGDSKFVDACQELFKVFKSQLSDEYKQQLDIIKIYNDTPDNYTTVEEDKYNELNGVLDDEYYPVFDKFSAAQEEFADKWGFILDYSGN